MNELRPIEPLGIEPIEELMRGFMRNWRGDTAIRAPQIKLDVHDRDDSYLVQAEIPGVRKQDIDVRIDGRQLTISAETKRETEEKGDDKARVLRSERQYGFASRSFTLDCDVDDSKAAAKYENGVLELTLPKKATAASKRLEVA